MKLCEDGHDEICFEYGKCPACVLISEYADQIGARDDEIAELKAKEKEREGSLREAVKEIQRIWNDGDV
jgi:hypothetical protein